MMKYKGWYMRLFSMLLRKPMVAQCGTEITSKTLKRAPIIYRQLLARTEDIGADNPMAINIYACFVFFAIWEAADGAITQEDMRQFMKEMMNRRIVCKVMGGRNINRPKDLLKMKKQFHKMKAWADAHPQYKDKTWDFNFDESKHQDGIYYHFTRCPLEKFARENGFLDILPVACEVDYLTIATQHGVLHREHTLATGGSICDYWIVPDQVNNPK